MIRIYAAACLLPISGSPIQGGAVAVDNGLIVEVGSLHELRRRFSAQVHDFPGAVIMPGLVNAHTHLELTHFPLWLSASGLDTTIQSYVDWIIRVISVKRRIGHEALAASLADGLNLVMQSGTTMVGDILSERSLLPQYGRASISGRVYLEFLGQDQTRYQPMIDTIGQDIDSLPPGFLPGISPHAPFTVAGHLLDLLLDAARSRGLPLTMHLAESADEISFFQNSTGRIAEELYPFVGWESHVPSRMGVTPTQWLDCRNAFGQDFLAVHGVHLSREDIRILQQRRASVVLVPRSNHKLRVGKAPVKTMVEEGIQLALGTDSLASCDTLSLWDEIRFLLDTFQGAFSPADALRMATLGGAVALRRNHEAGTLEAGKRADFIVVETAANPDSGRICEQIVEDSRVIGVWSHGRQIWQAAG